MYISKLEIFGFKSFANKTSLSFVKGINGIVGPNGCGKTNIVDAIRWVLGEQKSSTLRSDKMENVIFNGTKKRKPLGMSEVSLTFVNDDGTLPTDYSEVTITRRIFRSGESEYLLNKNVCRLKDITNLFMDTGMATNAYSVIELKMVEGILNDKTGERRKMFEEAAGVNKYKHRRKLSLKRLQEVKADLTRVNDIISEVEKTVRSLERQAKKADKYNTLITELKEREIEYSERKYLLLSKDYETLNSQKIKYVEQRDLIDEEIRNIEPELVKLRDEILKVERELRFKQQEISKANEKKHEHRKNISVAEERKTSSEKNINLYEEEIDELKIQREENERKIELVRNKIKELSDKIDALQIEINEYDEIIKREREAVNSQKELSNQKENEFRQIEIKLNNKANEISSIEKNIEERKSRIERLNNKIIELTNNIAKTTGFIASLENEKAEAEKTLEANEKTLSELLAEKEKLEKKISELKEKELSEKSLLNALKDKIEFLRSLIENLEGVSKGAKVLINNNEWTSKEKTLFADVGNADERYRNAVEASLKYVLNSLLIDDVETLKKGIEYLKENDFGKASFYLLGSPGNSNKTFFGKIDDIFRNKKNKKLINEKGFEGFAISFVKAEEKWKPYFEKILKNYAVVKTLDDALSLVAKYPDFIFVTPEGDLVRSDGIIEAGSLPKMDESIFGRKQLTEELQREYEKKNQLLDELRDEIISYEEKLSEIDLDTVSERGKRLVNEINNLEKQISRMETENEKFNEQIEEIRTEIKKETAELNELEDAFDEKQKELNEIETEKNRLKISLDEEREKLKEKTTEFEAIAQKQNERFLQLERLTGSLRNERNTLESTEKQIQNINESIERLEEAVRKSKNDIEEVELFLDSAKDELEEIEDELNLLYDERKEIDNKLHQLKEDGNSYESKLRTLRNERTEVSDKIHEIELKLGKINYERNSLYEHIVEEYSIKLGETELEPKEDYDFENEHNEILHLKEKIKNLGPINSLAYSEYEEEKERLDFLLSQRNDLIEAEKDLVNTINEINEKAQNQFMEVFEQIRENFKKNFRTLFDPGDEADLVMEEHEDPLEAKIEIIAKPKGKRPTSIDLLSQGEKTLTATALLFAFYLVKPSPFCILDEVDAPLDDANIDRFTRLLKEFVNRTQFIIVTHNKRTMEVADAMFGVTMTEEGVSKLAAIQFEELQSVAL